MNTDSLATLKKLTEKKQVKHETSPDDRIQRCPPAESCTAPGLDRT